MYKRTSKSGLFLMELIIVILFFSLTSAITIQIFVKSHIISQKTVELSHATMISQNIAEIFRSSNGDMYETALILPMLQETDSNHYTLFYNNHWDEQPFFSQDGFQCDIQFTQNDDIANIQIKIYKCSNKEEITHLSVSKYEGFSFANQEDL